MKSIITSGPPRLLALLFGAALFGLVSQSALAAGTLSNTDILNMAKLSYAVGGTPQNEICSATAGNTTGNGGTTGTTCTSGTNGAVATTFKVDNKVNLTVAKVADASIVPNSTNRVLAFTVTNNGNTTQRYALTTVAGAFTATMSNVRIYRDNGSTVGVFDGTDTLYVDASTFGDVIADGSLSILIVADQTAPTATNGQTAIYHLVAQTVNAGTIIVTANDSAIADTPGTVQVVWADLVGSAAGDVATDGRHSQFATYTVATAALSVSKTATLLCDPFNGVTNPKNIPGSMTRWTITVSNAAGGAAATLTTVADTLSVASLTIDPGTVATGPTVPINAATCVAGAGPQGFRVTVPVARILGGSLAGSGTASFFTTTTTADGLDFASPIITATFATILPIDAGTGHATAGLLNAGESVTVIFNTTVVQ